MGASEHAHRLLGVAIKLVQHGILKDIYYLLLLLYVIMRLDAPTLLFQVPARVQFVKKN